MAKDEHVGPIELSTRTVKNNCITMAHNTPCRRVTKVMVIALVKCTVLWMNAFPSKNGVSKTLIRADIGQGRT